MTNKTVQLGVVAVSALVVQQALMTHFRLFGVHPELLLASALVVAASGGPRRGAVAGFLAGLATDIYGSSTIGVTALAFVVTAWLVGRLGDERPGYLAAAVAGLGGTAGGLLLLVVISHVVDGTRVGAGHAIWVFVVAGLVNAAIVGSIAPRVVSFWRRQELVW